ncbi:MAG: ferritin-like domain-containing protein [Proteobacteria bacterium]|nr:ferritin-like domain-containing protein [Pseudomonadota bacterium]
MLVGSSLPEISALEALAAKGEAQQWSFDDIDWDIEAVVPAWLPRKFCAALISQFYHGEMATLAMCRRILAEVDTPVRIPGARRCVELQIADETRHAEVYRAYVAGIGGLQPIDPTLKAAYDKALAWDGPPEAMIAAFNIVLEGEALFALDTLGGWLPCPRFRRINARVSRDEARHLAFGRAYLKARLVTLGGDRRFEIYRWLKDLWTDTAFGVLGRFPIPNAILGRRCRTWAETGWQDHRRALFDVGLVSADEARRLEGGT